jgi:hypothetical protein
MMCPICKDGKLAFCQDSIIAYAMYEAGGVPDVSNIILESNGLDKTWVECSRCYSTSDDNSVLENIYKNIGKYPQTQLEMQT